MRGVGATSSCTDPLSLNSLQALSLLSERATPYCTPPEVSLHQLM